MFRIITRRTDLHLDSCTNYCRTAPETGGLCAWLDADAGKTAPRKMKRAPIFPGVARLGLGYHRIKWWAVQDSNLRPPACKADLGALEEVLSNYANQFLTHNKSSHGRFRGTLKSLEKLINLQASRHIYGTLI